VAGSFGSRVALLLWSAWLLAMASPTGTHDAGAPSAGGSDTTPTPSETAPDESAEPDSHEEAEEPADEAAPADHEGSEQEAPEEQEPPAQRLVANPAAPERENGEPTLQGASTRGDFLRRLRASAENVERVRASERTLARTENGVTVLSNVDQPPVAATAVPVVAEVADQPTRVQLPRPEPSVGSPAAADDAPAATPRATRRQPAENDGHWHWLWVLGGVATVLLVPIAMLLTRATRSG
jgi:hypothetical protein